MVRLYACLTAEHDPFFVAIAVAILLTAAGTAMFTARKAVRRPGLHWPLLAGFVLGGGAWSTHFVAMLGYAPDVPVTYDIRITLGSAAVGVIGAALGITLWSRARGTAWRALGGGTVGAAIAAMHYLGMAGLHVPGVIIWSPDFVALSVGSGILVMALAFLSLRKESGLVLPAFWVVVAIACLHFIGMAAGTLLPDAGPVAAGAAQPRFWLATLVAGVTLLWLATALGIPVSVARQRKRQTLREMHRIRALADATLEAIVLCDGRGIVTDANARLAELVGRPPEALIGQRIETLIATAGGEPLAATAAGQATALGATLCGTIPIELLRREIETAEGHRTVYALRDLRERIASQDRISHLARHDPLTGAANRAALNEQLRLLVQRDGTEGAGFALFCIDLDRFKPVNDLYGHAQGDRILVELVVRLRSQAAKGDMVARLGGDEFVVVAPSVTTPAEAARVAERMVGLLQIGLDGPSGHTDPVTASVGVAMFPADGDTPESLLRAGDLSMYRAKRDSGDGFAFYHAGMDEELRLAQLLEMDVRQAVARGELKLEFQPIAAAPGPQVVGFEALVRWDHPQRGRVPPDLFIGVAETCGAILGIGEWVLRTACREAARWSNALTVAVNVSPVQVQTASFAARVEEILAETGLPPQRLELEVTESLFISEPAKVTETLNRLRRHGVRIALDDFGTGYSSLATLRNFTFDKVKIDRSFIGGLGSDVQADAIVRGVLGLASGLGLPVVAEGVESDYQLDRLRAEGCDAVQGYLIGRPRPIGAYARLTGAGTAPAARRQAAA